MSDAPSLGLAAGGVLAAATGAYQFFRPATAQARIEAAHQARLDDRLTRGADAYHEELRSLRACSPARGLRRRRLIGLLTLLFGLICLAVTFLPAFTRQG